MSLPTRSEQTAPSERRCRCLLLRWWCHCKFSASVADCGAILNRSVFPECLWLIWHFSLNPSRCLSSLQLYLSPSLSLYPSFHCSNSRLPLFKYLSSPFFSLILFTDISRHHFLISLNIHQVSFNQHELLSLLCAVNGCIAFQVQGQKSQSKTVSPSLFVLILQKQSPLHQYL